ncbi:class II D-tagatose-bisphosphate aldolase, non-catalytic subunit [Micromonospora sp. NPDC049559]|uniref:class II D-tagatose-bisphosphate aldolase non-catalytic subunit n=1 Tax=Micromonospora sp. NPDC049559 TaxID=3155923 RepID=UPI00344690E2
MTVTKPRVTGNRPLTSQSYTTYVRPADHPVANGSAACVSSCSILSGAGVPGRRLVSPWSAPHPAVVETAVSPRARRHPAAADTTSNQVDQPGGYPGTRPSDGRDLGLGTTERIGSFEVARF